MKITVSVDGNCGVVRTVGIECRVVVELIVIMITIAILTTA